METIEELKEIREELKIIAGSTKNINNCISKIALKLEKIGQDFPMESVNRIRSPKRKKILFENGKIKKIPPNVLKLLLIYPFSSKMYLLNVIPIFCTY